ncbi:hypothetical protein SPACI_033030 [Sporomusa acidovorans DSM 3132]|uniref:Uncharacterized protein n=1 Tax=Sporomusa acidovorans (strain ATCC 49682 / DSM 3132 / Mol) TaxID=1123286 RepID=A0ABZ3J4C5_SPOA4|nr:hypothetical protein SPACI_43150 [Sporomusa acidovorans DSM 3132]SDE99262.1 hypothetical protein SAMN04488499_10292 [Sporomusa acidovorans]
MKVYLSALIIEAFSLVLLHSPLIFELNIILTTLVIVVNKFK